MRGDHICNVLRIRAVQAAVRRDRVQKGRERLEACGIVVISAKRVTGSQHQLPNFVIHQAAGIAKLGAALGVFLFPIVLEAVDEWVLLAGLAGVCVVGFIVTLIYQIEPAGKSLDEVSGRKAGALAARID